MPGLVNGTVYGKQSQPETFIPLRPRPNDQEDSIPSFDQIHFPKVYEDAWRSADGGDVHKSDFERGRIFLVRMANLNANLPEFRRVRDIVTNPKNRSIPALVTVIQHQIFGNRHVSYATTSLLQCVRFMLLKCNVSGVMVSDRARSAVDFYFDPTLERNLQPLPLGEMVTYRYPAGRLKVVIVGGGPTALASAIALAEKGAGKVEVHMYERRWVQTWAPDGRMIIDYPPTARRRDQVVTLQDSVTTLLSKGSYEALFAGRPERVWPGSANIQIRKVEDRFLKRVQDPEFHGTIYLHTEALTRETLHKAGDFHVLLGADGAASWVRRSYFHGYENERGRSYALGLAFNRPVGLPWSQPLNVFLTLGQTRYLLNASDHDGRGYLNMQLTEEEWHKMVSVDGEPIHFGRPGCLRKSDGSVPDGFEPHNVFAPSEDRDSPLWTAIADGLKLFGFKEDEVINVVRIPIVVQAVREGTQYLPREDMYAVNRPRALAAVAGDAAMTVHFWPGRGLNSGIKEGLAFADELTIALANGRFVGMPIEALATYNNFILKLQDREHDKRSIPILNQSGSPEMLGWLLERASGVPDNVAIEWLIGAMVQIADRLEQREDWAYPAVSNVEPQLRIVLRQLSSTTLKEMAVSFPWPTREMAGAEVLPTRSMKPEEKQKWLSSVWGMLRDERKRDHRARSSDRSASGQRTASASRFEAPRSKSPGRPSSSSSAASINATPSARHGRTLSVPRAPVLPTASSDATRSGRHGRTLSVPGPPALEEPRSRTPSPAESGEVNLGRMLTVHRKPPKAVLDDAMSLALFRVSD